MYLGVGDSNLWFYDLRRLTRVVAVTTTLLATIACDTAAQDLPHSAVHPRDTDSTAAQPRYVASSRGQVYYWTGCDAWRSLSVTNRLWFETKEEAEDAGYRPSASPGCAGPSQIEATGRCVVERIIDGDTIVCSRERIRLLLVDAPEDRQEDLGLRARLALEEVLPLGSTALVEFDVERRDRYGRLLAYVHLPDGTFINDEIVRRGYAVVLVYPPNVRHAERLRAAATGARESEAGLWAVGGFECLPKAFRAGHCQ